MRRIRLPDLASSAVVVGLVLVTAGCGSSAPGGAAGGPSSPAAESNPAGDIPDDQVFVPFTPDYGLFTVSVPEGWARSSDAAAVIFTDKLNSVRVEAVPAPNPPDVASATGTELPAIQAATAHFTAGDVTTVTRTAGDAVLITYEALSVPDPVTGKTVTDAVERYEFWQAGQEAVLTVSGPVGADNVDPWKTITDSFSWAR